MVSSEAPKHHFSTELQARLALPYHSAVRFVTNHHTVRSGYPVASAQPSRSRVSIDEQHIALPKLYGAPAYARPPARVAVTSGPSTRTSCRSWRTRRDEELEFAELLPARAYAPGGCRAAQERPWRAPSRQRPPAARPEPARDRRAACAAAADLTDACRIAV